MKEWLHQLACHRRALYCNIYSPEVRPEIVSLTKVPSAVTRLSYNSPGHCNWRALPQDDYVTLQKTSDVKKRGNLHFFNTLWDCLGRPTPSQWQWNRYQLRLGVYLHTWYEDEITCCNWSFADGKCNHFGLHASQSGGSVRHVLILSFLTRAQEYDSWNMFYLVLYAENEEAPSYLCPIFSNPVTEKPSVPSMEVLCVFTIVNDGISKGGSAWPAWSKGNTCVTLLTKQRNMHT